MTARGSESVRKRGQVRDDQAVLSEAHEVPPRVGRGQVYATGETREGRSVFRTTRFYGMVFVTIAEQYQQTHAPVPCETCKEAVFAHSETGRGHKNPFAILAQLEKPGLLQVDDRNRDSDRLPRVDNVIVELDDGTVLWPKIAEPVPVTAPSGASGLTNDAFIAELRVRFAGREFTSRDVLTEIEDAGESTLYDRLRRLQRSGAILLVGGTRGSRKDPARFRFAGDSSFQEPALAEPPATVSSPAIVSKDDLARRLEAKDAELVRMRQDEERRGAAAERKRLAAAESDRLRALLAEEEAKVAAADAELAEIDEVDPGRVVALEADVRRDAAILADYEDLVSRLTRP